jgi:hypothetical protein
MNLIRTCFIALSLLVATSANAAIVYFDFTGTTTNVIQNSFSFSSGGYILTATAKANKAGETGPVNVEQWLAGIGVDSGDRNNRLDSNISLDEILTFSLTSAGDPNARFSSGTVFFGNLYKSKLESGEIAELRFGYPHKAIFANGNNGNSAGFSLNGFAKRIELQSPQRVESDNGFRVQGIAIDVPEPTSLAIISLGLLGLGARRFKK